MNKVEFLEELRRALMGEIPDYEINKHIAYYEEYISQGPESEREKLEELGEPRLIAKTITDTYTMSHGQRDTTANTEYYEETAQEYDTPDDDIMNNKNVKLLMSGKIPLTWKIGGIVALVVLIIVLVVVGGIVLRFALPIIAVLIVIRLIQQIINK